MKVIKQATEFWGQTPTDPLELYKWIEKAGRTCYKSEDKITEDTAIPFCFDKSKVGHTSVLEHSNIVIKIPIDNFPLEFLYTVFGSRVQFHQFEVIPGFTYVNGNLLAWLQTFRAGLKDPLIGLIHHVFAEHFSDMLDEDGMPTTENTADNPVAFVSDPDEIPLRLRKYTVKHITNRAMTHECVRHRIDSAYSQESQRYCGYDGIKFDGEITFVVPVWATDLLKGANTTEDTVIEDERSAIWLSSAQQSEQLYMALRERGASPQQAREVLINSTKTEIVVTRGTEAWLWFFNLRNSSAADPMMQDMSFGTLREFKNHSILGF